MRIAVISDVHGNLPALDAVLAAVAAEGADLTVNLGDLLSGFVQPAATAERLMAAGLPTVAGNHERQLLTWEWERMGAEAGSPHARYAVADDSSGRWEAALRQVAYPWQEAAACAEAYGQAGGAYALRTGRVAA